MSRLFSSLRPATSFIWGWRSVGRWCVEGIIRWINGISQSEIGTGMFYVLQPPKPSIARWVTSIICLGLGPMCRWSLMNKFAQEVSYEDPKSWYLVRHIVWDESRNFAHCTRSKRYTGNMNEFRLDLCSNISQSRLSLQVRQTRRCAPLAISKEFQIQISNWDLHFA